MAALSQWFSSTPTGTYFLVDGTAPVNTTTFTVTTSGTDTGGGSAQWGPWVRQYALPPPSTVTYAPPTRPFNRYLNASDLLEEFIAFLGELGVPQGDVLDVPLDVLIHWMIMRAAQQDGQPLPDGVLVYEHPKLPLARPRCTRCGRFVRRGGTCAAHQRRELALAA